MSERSLTDVFARLRRRVLAIDGAAGAVWGVVAAALWIAAAVWLDLLFELGPRIRIALLATALVAAAVVVGSLIRRAIIRGAVPALARRVDDVARTGGQILSGVELAAASPPADWSARPELSAGLSRLAVDRATRLANGVSRRDVVPLQPLGRSSPSLAATALVSSAVVVFLPRLAATEWRRFADPFGDHPPFSALAFDIDPGDARVVYGSALEIHVTVSGGLVDAVDLVVDSPALAGEPLPMFAESPGHWRASLANVTEPGTYHVRARGARSARHRIDVITVPKIESVVFQVRPPAYTRMPATEGALPEGGLSGLPGTIVRATIRSNRPLSGGLLKYITPGGTASVPLATVPAAADTVSGEFPLTDTGKIELTVTDVDGTPSTESFTAPVTILVDERPFVRLIEPKAVSFATPTAVMPIVVSAEDDYGVARLQLFRSLNDSRALPMDIAIPTPPPRQTYQIVKLPLVAYGLEPGDEIKAFARVEDNDPHGNEPGPAAAGGADQPAGKGSESSIVLIRIISQEEFERVRQTRDGMEVLLSKYRQARRRMESLADEVESLEKKAKDAPGDQKADDALRDGLRQLAQRLRREAEALRKLQQDKKPFDLDAELTKELEKLEQTLERLTKQADDLAANENLTADELEKALDALREELKQGRERLDQEAMEPLERLAQLMPLKKDESRFVRLYQRQRELAGRLKSLEGQDDGKDPALKARMRDLEGEQRQIRLDLEGLLTDIEEHAGALPDEPDLKPLRESALKFVKDVRDSGAADAMTDAETGLAEFSGTRGHEGAQKAADILEKFLEQNEGMGNQAGGMVRSFRPGLGDAMEQALQQLLRTAGLGQMPGDGEGGSGGGYSTSRNTLDNVGLYGDDPSLDDPQSGDGLTSRPASESRVRNPGSRGSDGPEAPVHSAETQLRAAGSGESTVPLRYRKKVGRYFQRLADELGDK